MVDQVLPHQSFNLIALFVSFLAFVWGWHAFRRFWDVLHYRYAVLTDNTVMLRGLGGTLDQFSGTMPSHTRSILHTRNSSVVQDVKFVYMPFWVSHVMKPAPTVERKPKTMGDARFRSDVKTGVICKSASDDRLSIPVIGTARSNDSNGNNRHVRFDMDNSGPYGFLNANFSAHPTNDYRIVPKRNTRLCGYIPVWCATECTILVLYGLQLDTVKRFFGYSIKANRLFTKGSKYKDRGNHKSASKGKKSKKKKNNDPERGATESRHIYAERLIALFTKKELCSAYATFEPTDFFADDHTTASDRIYNVPVYNTFDENNNVDSSSESNVSSYSQMEEIDLSLRDNHVNIPDRSSTYSRVSSGQETSSSAGSDSTSSNRFSRFMNPNRIENGSQVSTPSPTDRSIGILIIPRDLPVTATPEYISCGTSSSNDSKGSCSGHEGDIELGNAFISNQQGHTLLNRRGSGGNVDRSKYDALDFGLQVLHPKKVTGESQNEFDYDELFVHTGGSMFAAGDIYGLPSAPGSVDSPHFGENSPSECVICLTEVQEIFLLPCRHLCICKDCFPHIDKCPVCRTPFDDYVTLRPDNLISVKAPKCVKESLNDDSSMYPFPSSDDEKLKSL